MKDGAERRKQKPGSPALLLAFNSVGCCTALDTGDDGFDLPHHTRSNATERLVISFKAHWPLDVAGLCQLGEKMWSNHAVAFEQGNCDHKRKSSLRETRALGLVAA
jgi:hypothetical protein